MILELRWPRISIKSIVSPVSGREKNFDIMRGANTQGVPYDYSSIMHYRANAFSTNQQPTIEPKNSSVPLDSLGQRDGFSLRDLQHVNTLYCTRSEHWTTKR